MAMATQADPVGEFNTILGAAGDMVRRLATGSGSGKITTSTRIAEVGTFQRAWNESVDLVVDELDAMTRANTPDDYFMPVPGSLTERALAGLKVDERYGPVTATALLLTLWARSGEWKGDQGIPEPLLRIPADPRYWPQKWASDREYWTAMLTKVIVSKPGPQPPPAPEPGPLPDVISDPEPESPVPSPAPVPSPEVTFGDDEVEPVYGQTKGQKSNAPLIMGGAALLLVGGVVAYTASRKGRRG